MTVNSSQTIPTLFGHRRGSLGGLVFTDADLVVGGRTLVHGLTATISPGKLTALYSPERDAVDGAFEALTRGIHPARGTALVGGVDIAQLTRAEVLRLRRERVGIVGPGYRLASSRTLAENLKLPFQIAEMPLRDTDRAWLDRLVETFGLGDDLHRYPFELCSARHDRAAIARALALRPGLLLLREAFTGDDAHGGAVLMALVRALVQEHAVTTVLCTTNTKAVESCDVVVEVNTGAAEQPARRVSSSSR